MSFNGAFYHNIILKVCFYMQWNVINRTRWQIYYFIILHYTRLLFVRRSRWEYPRNFIYFWIAFADPKACHDIPLSNELDDVSWVAKLTYGLYLNRWAVFTCLGISHRLTLQLTKCHLNTPWYASLLCQCLQIYNIPDPDHKSQLVFNIHIYAVKFLSN